MIEKTRCYQKQDLTAEGAEAFAEDAEGIFLLGKTTMKSKAFVRRSLVVCLLLLATSVAIFAQEPPLRIDCHLAMSQPSTHLFQISINIDIPSDPKINALDFQMPKWSPGRYAVFDFAKNVQEVSARNVCPPGLDCDLANPPITRIDDQTWRVDAGRFKPSGSQTIVFFNYKVFANDLSGTFSELDSRHANFTGGGLLISFV